MARKIARVDANQPKIVSELRNSNIHVAHTHTIGSGFPDIICTAHGKQSNRLLALLVEIKQAGKKLTDDEADWHSKYPAGGPLLIAYCAQDVIDWFNVN